ncbi:MAG: transporter [Oscillospiraceae bacterium]|nr:transporter [Oscillospiraceae bacterium]
MQQKPVSQYHKSSFKHKVNVLLARVAEYLEILVALVVVAALICSFIPLVKELPAMLLPAEGVGTDGLQQFLGHAFNLIIAIEFIKMLTKHNPGSALEVLMYAIARHMVIGGDHGVDLLINVCAIALIFAVRKYLFVSSFGIVHRVAAAAAAAQPAEEDEEEDEEEDDEEDEDED